MPSAATQMNPEMIMLSEGTQRGKDRYRMASLTCEIKQMLCGGMELRLPLELFKE